MPISKLQNFRENVRACTQQKRNSTKLRLYRWCFRAQLSNHGTLLRSQMSELLREHIKGRRGREQGVQTDGPRKNRTIIGHAPALELLLHVRRSASRQQACETLGPHFHPGQFGRARRPVQALVYPAENVLPQEEEHADLRISSGKQPLLQGFRVGSVAWDDAG